MPTFRRPLMLHRLLHALISQRTHPSFTHDIVVVDNDRGRSAESVVNDIAASTPIHLWYACEPEQNIARARNRAIERATGNLVAFLDDDEHPVNEWLVRLYQTWKRHECDGVLGPVVPEFPADAPVWARRGGLFDRPRLPSGSRVTARHARTGNVLLRRSLFTEDAGWFDPAFGLTGGEDTDFFRRQFERGRVFIWCDEAVACETVPLERCTVAFQVKRYLRSGTIDGELMREGQIPLLVPFAKNVAVVCAGLAVGPLTLVLQKHARVRFWRKLAYSGGLVSAAVGVSLLRLRD